MHIPPPIQTLIPSIEISADGRVSCSLEEFRTLVRMAIIGVPVDETWYRNTYEDVAAAIAKGELCSGLEHYGRSGYLDGRFPFRPVVDERWYFENNQDVIRIRGDVNGAYQHFWNSGYLEGRIPHKPTLDRRWYSHRYPDAKKQVDEGVFPTFEAHFTESGYKKGFF